MLLLLIDSLLLLALTICIGLFSHAILQKLFNVFIKPELLAIFLLGLFASSIYFSILSFWLPLDYFTLIPLGVLGSISGFTLRDRLSVIFRSLFPDLRLLASPYRLAATACLFTVLFYFWIIPPGNVDSPNYHYLSILWYERYKVIPGLANVHSAYAYNPISFVLQAPWSFTRITGQSLYPLNGVVLGLFFSWLLLRSFRTPSPGMAAVYLGVILILFTPLLQNISAPSSDSLVDVCLAWPIIRLTEVLLFEKPELSNVLVPALILLYAPVAKLSSFYVLPIPALIFFFLPRNEKKPGLIFKTIAVGALVYIPWIGRNYIMTGYPIYFYSGLDFFHPDWQVPPSLLRLQTYLTCIQTKVDSPDVTWSTPLPLSRWFLPWINAFFINKTPLNAAFFFAGMLSPLYWFLPGAARRCKRPLLLWLLTYAGVWTWFLSAPALRFGAVPLTLSAVIPILCWLSKGPDSSHPDISSGFPPANRPPAPAAYPLLLTLLLIAGAFYYIRSGSKKPTTYPFALKDCWLFPLKDIAYTRFGGEHRRKTFPYHQLNAEVKMYIADDNHICICTDLPCMGNYYGDLEARGSSVEDGFRMKKDRIPELFPCTH
ncbi:MAG: hypothetical protein JST42_15085 [Bacteroidetes bacterium]|nr:hypothetical protein [Bacteroidota bacterium]